MSTSSLRPWSPARGLALLLLGAAFTASAAAPAVDWPQWRGPNRDGLSTETGWLTEWPKNGPRRLWSGKVGLGWSSVAVAGSKGMPKAAAGR